MPHLKPTYFDVTKHSDYFLERTRQSAWLDAVTTPLTRRDWILVYQNTSFWRELSNQRYRQKKTWNALSDALLMSHFQNFAAGATKKNRVPRSFLKPCCARFWLFINSNEFGAKDSEKLFPSMIVPTVRNLSLFRPLGRHERWWLTNQTAGFLRPVQPEKKCCLLESKWKIKYDLLPTWNHLGRTLGVAVWYHVLCFMNC